MVARPLILVWIPRVLAIAMALFVSVFALDVFDQGLSVIGTIEALARHLVPTSFVLAALAVAWRWPLAGGVLFILLAIGYSAAALGHIQWLIVIGGPLLLIGALFVWSGMARQRA